MTTFSAKDSTGTPQTLTLLEVSAAGTPSSTGVVTVQGNPSGTPVPVSVTGTAALATGAATEAAQETAQANLTSLDTKILTPTAPGTPQSTAQTVQVAQGGVAIPVTVTGTPQTTTLSYGSVTVGTTAVQLPAHANLINGVNLKSKAANTGTINIGGDTSVTTTTGFELSAGNATFQAVSNSNQLWAIASAASQVLNFTCS